MKKEKQFYIAFEICKFLNEREPVHRRFKDWELAMYSYELFECINIAIEQQDKDILKQYYDVLENELEEMKLLNNNEETKKVKRYIKLLDKCVE